MSPADPFIAPGAFCPSDDRWGRFLALVRGLPEHALVLLDRRVAKLHPKVRRELQRRAAVLIELPAGERTKTLAALEEVAAAAVSLPRSGALVAVGGGTIGDLGTVAAHLIKRGLKLIQVPTTLLAAVDSSLGGKGAVHAGAGRQVVKNALGVFHYAAETWLCPELFSTLPARQLREGRIEAWKMVVTLDAAKWHAYRREEPGLEALIREARALKAAVCARDPYELEGHRRVLNFGHTFGHVLESLTRFRLSHGDAVGLGMLCALDLGRTLGVTDPALAEEVEAGLRVHAGVPTRPQLTHALTPSTDDAVARLLAADKKADRPGEVKMVLVERLGHAVVRPVPARAWRAALRAWRRGARP